MSPTAKTLRMARDREIGPDADPVAALQLEPERLDELVALQACAPDERVRGDLRPGLSATRVGATDATRAPVTTSTVRFSSASRRVLAEVRLEHPEDVRPRLDQDDPRFLLRDARVVPGEVVAIELGDRPGAFDAGRPAADDDDVERAVLDQARVLVGRLPPPEHVLLQPDRVGEGVHRKGVLGGPLGPEERDLCAEPEHEDSRRSGAPSPRESPRVPRGRSRSPVSCGR